LDESAVYIRVPAAEEYSELVRKKESQPDANSFMSDLFMSGFSVKSIGSLSAKSVAADSVMADSLTLYGIEDGRKIKNKIAGIAADKAIFSGDGGGAAALTIQKGSLSVKDISARTVSQFGDAGNLTADVVSVHDFSMAAGRTGFSGPAKWEVKGDAVLENVTLSVERLDISSFINASRGQDVFISDDGLSYSVKTGIEADYAAIANITVRDQISSSLAAGGTGPVILDIRPAGTTVLPDAFVNGIDNDAVFIPSSHDDNTGKTASCKSIIDSLDSGGMNYNKQSLAQHLVCQFVFWQRLEKRIDMKKCLMEGRSGC
jgi:hypothetical protein